MANVPVISGFRVYRCDKNGVINRYGTYLLVGFSWVTKPGKLYNLKITWWNTLEGEASGDEYNFILSSGIDTTKTQYGNIKQIVGGSIDPDVSYEVEVFIEAEYTDDEGNVTYSSHNKTIFLSDLIYLMDFRAGGYGMAIGKEAELDGYLDVELNTKLRNLQFPNCHSIFGIDTSGNEYEAFTAMSGSNNVTMGYGLFVNRNTDDKPIGDSRIYGGDVYVCSAKAGGTADKTLGFRPYYRAGDTINVNIRTTGYLTSSKSKVYFTVPLDKPVIGSPNTDIISPDDGGFLLRQLAPSVSVNTSDTKVTKLDTAHKHSVEFMLGGRYTHGSYYDANNLGHITANETKVLSITTNGINIEATFDADAEASNNTPIGVDWIGQIKLS